MSSLVMDFFVFVFWMTLCVPSVLDKDDNHQDKDDNVEGQDHKDGAQGDIQAATNTAGSKTNSWRRKREHK